MSKKMRRLISMVGRSKPGRRRYVRRHVAHRAARDFRYVMIAALVIGVFFNLLNMVFSSSEGRPGENKTLYAAD